MPEPIRRRVTIKDVAQRANVALGTVSRIINGNATVAPELRKHVEGVIEELGYRPSVTARTMRTNRTDAIGIVVTDLRQPVAAAMVAAASEAARSAGFAPIVGDFLNDVQTEEMLLRFMSERNVDGLLLTISSDESPEVAAMLETLQVPVVLWERAAGAQFPSVRSDHRLGTRMAAEALLARGRRDVLLVAGHEHTWTGREQLAGMREGLGDRARLSMVHTGRFSPAALAETLKGPAPHDAIVANVHDIPDILEVVQRSGLHCPDSLSVISIGDHPLFSVTAPPISAVRLHPETVAIDAVQRLVKLIRKQPPGPETALIRPDFVPRASV